MATIPEALALAIDHHQAGRLQVAEQIYQQILKVEPNHPDVLHLLGVLASMQGKQASAIKYMTEAVKLNPLNAELHSNLSVALREQGNLDAAIACCRRALALKPDFAQAHHNMGVALKGQGKLDEAIASFGTALHLAPAFAEAHYNLGIALKAQKKRDEAVSCYRQAIALKPDYAEVHNNLGIALAEQGKLEEAAACYRRALQLNADYAEAHSNLGVVLGDQGKLDEAVACYGRALALKPGFAEAHYNLGVTLLKQGKLDEAIACYRRALALKPDYADAHSNLGVALSDQGKLDEAMACYRRALALNPDYADAHSNLGIALGELGKLDEAALCYRRALSLNPDHADARLNQSLLMLLTGDLERGWAEYEWRWQVKPRCFQRRSFSQPLWDGQPLAGRTILLYAEQGLGDTIQFVRYAPLVQDRGGRVILECQPRVLPLLAGFPGVDQIIVQGESLPGFDVQAPLLSLPRIFGTTLNSVPARTPYLRAEPKLVEFWRKRLENVGGFKVGIVWQGSPQYMTDHLRSIPLRYYEALARVEGVRLVSLQMGAGADQLRAAPFPVLDLAEEQKTIGDTAAVLANLDLLVSSCTMVPHLAGALGMPVWLALPLVPDWRWLLGRDDSPWYPHHRLFRQTRPGDWSEVFERMAVALAAVKKGDRSQESGDE